MTGTADSASRQRRKLRLRPLPTLIVAVLTGLLLSLSAWQLDRAAQKRALLAAFDGSAEAVSWRLSDAPPARYTRVALQGEYLTDRQVLMDGMIAGGRVGYQVLTPLRVASGEVVLVNRGWRPFEGSRETPPAPPAPAGDVSVSGRVTPFIEPGVRLAGGNDEAVSEWPMLAVYPTAADVSRWLGTGVAPAVVLLDADQPHGFVRRWRPAQMPPSRHLGYAVQWFALAVALVVLFVIASRERVRRPGDSRQ